MNKKFILAILLAAITILSSCISIIATVGDLKNTKPTVRKIPCYGKEIYFISMKHLDKQEFYDNTKNIAENYQKNGYVFYVESIKNMVDDTVALKKFRKLLNLDLRLKYSEIDNELLIKMREKYNFVDQPKYEKMGINAYKITGYAFTDLIGFWEVKYGTINLDSCDINTQLRDKYKCSTYKVHDKKLL